MRTQSIILLCKIISSIASAALLANCSAKHSTSDLVGDGLAFKSENSIPIFESTLKPILQNCHACHGFKQNPRFAVTDSQLSHDTLISFRLVDLASPGASRIVQKIRSGHQSFGLQLADQMEVKIEAWSLQLSATGGDTGVEPVQLLASFKSIHALILIPKCVGCHSEGGERPQEDYSNFESTLKTGKVTPGNARDSGLFTECDKGEMPKDAPLLSEAELNVLSDWINQGAKNN